MRGAREGVAIALTCIDFGRRGRRGDEGGDPSGVEADPESRERSPRMEPGSFPFLVGESTAADKGPELPEAPLMLEFERSRS
jgi:hypothetical protein